MDWKNLHGYIEVSPFLLFESTGDSEEDSHLTNCPCDDGDDDKEVTPACDDVDDCQSCCSDSSEICNTYHDNDNDKNTELVRVHGYVYDSNKRHRNDYDEDEDEDEGDDDGAVSQECSSRNAGFGYSRAQVKKCKVYVDSRLDSIKKEEKDKLFWDACLAS
ncbi:hypothetical protein ACET3Z_019183 [Daucus carota]